MRTNQIRVEKFQPPVRKISGRKNHNQRHNNLPPHNKKRNNNKKNKLFCAYCKKPNHDEHHCKTKRIDELENLLRKNKINVPNASKD